MVRSKLIDLKPFGSIDIFICYREKLTNALGHLLMNYFRKVFITT